MNNVLELPYHDARDIDAICADVRGGRGTFVTFGTSQGAFLEVAGPKGLPAWKLLCNAPVPHLFLHRLEPGGPIASAAANRDFPKGLDEIATWGEALLGDEAPILRALLAAVRRTTESMRFRVPLVAEIVAEEGDPSPVAWASCLPLGALQAAIQKATRIRAAA